MRTGVDHAVYKDSGASSGCVQGESGRIGPGGKLRMELVDHWQQETP